MSRRSAPSASRTPISRVRCATRKAITPKSPTAASDQRDPAKMPSSIHVEEARAERIGEQVVERADVEERHAGIDAADGVADPAPTVRRRHRSPLRQTTVIGFQPP